MPSNGQQTAPDDGLVVAEVGPWAERKYRLLEMYAGMFATATKKQWPNRVYIDLFSGCGRAMIRGTSRVVAASPLLALAVDDPFSVYVFCEKSTQRLEALRRRAEEAEPRSAVHFVSGNTNANVGTILSLLPRHSHDSGVISFCFADPWKLKNLRFATIDGLSARKVDFLVLIPTDYDANRNWRQYLRMDNTTVDEFLGTQDWRGDWESRHPKSQSFGAFLAEAFCSRMRALGYQFGGIDHNVHVRSDGNLPLYRLGFFSRHPLGEKLWRNAVKYGISQQDLFQA
jgi:three-Cys-motif partner protein